MRLLRRPRGPDHALFETVLVQDGRIRLLDRHLLRLRAAGGSPRQVSAVRGLAATWCRTARARPTVVRFDATPAGGVSAAARRPGDPGPVALHAVEGFDPADATRERKLADRTWTLAPEREARAAGADEALLVGGSVGPSAEPGAPRTGPFVGETTRASVLVLGADGVLRSPPVAGILPGVTRAWALEAATAMGVAVAEEPIPVADLADARVVLLATAGRGILPAGSLDGRPLATDPLAAELRRAWLALR